MKKVLHSEGNYSYCGIWVNKKKKKSRKDKSTAQNILGFFFFLGGVVFCQTMRKEFLMERSKKRSTERSLGTQQEKHFALTVSHIKGSMLR